MPDQPATQPNLTADQLRLLRRCATGAVVFFDERIVFCGNEQVTGIKLGDLVELESAGLLHRLSHQAFELTSFGRTVAQEVPVE